MLWRRAPASLRTQMPDLHQLLQSRTGEMLGSKYRLARLLGAGGFAAVYEAENTWTGRRVAIKILHPNVSKNPSALRRFMQEARIATRLAHPNIVEVLDLGQELSDGSFFIVQEFLEGEDLATRIAREKRLDAWDALDLVVPVMGALAAAHSHGVVHRDVTPGNIFLARTMEGVVPKLIDFGISKALDTVDREHRTRTGSVIGTPNYMSPEQARGERTLDARTDIWSMGAVLYEALSGRVPYDGDNYNIVLFKLLSSDPEPLESLVPRAPRDVVACVQHAMQRDRDYRLPTMRAFLSALLECEVARASAGRKSLADCHVSSIPDDANAVDDTDLVDLPPDADELHPPFDSAEAFDDAATEANPTATPVRPRSTMTLDETDVLPVASQSTPHVDVPPVASTPVALDACLGALQRSPPDLAPFLGLRDTLRAANDYQQLAAVTASAIDVLRRAGHTDRAFDLCRLLAAITHDHLNDAAGAIEAYRAALRLRPNDARAHTVFARLLREQGDVDGALDEWRRVLALDHVSGEALATLCSLHEQRHEKDKAWCVATVATCVLGSDVPPDVAALASVASAPTGSPRARLDDERFGDDVAHPSTEPFVGRALACLLPALRKIHAQPLDTVGLSHDRLQDESSSRVRLVRLMGVALRALGVRAMPLAFVDPRRAGILEPLGTDPPAYVVGGNGIGERPLAEAAFIAGRCAMWFRDEYAALLLVSDSDRLRASVEAAASLAGVPLQVTTAGASDDTAVARLAAELQSHAPALRQLRREIRLGLGPGEGVSVGAWRLSAAASADRAGMLLSGSIEVARRLIESEREDPESRRRAFRELALYATSEAYFRCRRALGIEVG